MNNRNGTTIRIPKAFPGHPYEFHTRSLMPFGAYPLQTAGPIPDGTTPDIYLPTISLLFPRQWNELQKLLYLRELERVVC